VLPQRVFKDFPFVQSVFFTDFVFILASKVEPTRAVAEPAGSERTSNTAV
jgi:hypothetical protein